MTPWLRFPLESIANPKIKKIVVLGSIGSGKTTIIEAAIPWRIANAPSNVLFVCQTDPDAAMWAESRLTPSLMRNPSIAPLLSHEKDKTRKTTIFFNTGIYLDIGGPSLSSLQNKSTPMVIIDEAWLLAAKHPGRIQEAKGRMHDKWNRQLLILSQGGEVDDDLDREFKSGTCHEFGFTCPHCEKFQLWKHKNLLWDAIRTENGELDVVETRKTVRYKCENTECNKEFADTVENRRMLSMRSSYERQNFKNQEEFISVHYNVLCVWWRDWWEHAIEWINAMDELAKGSKEMLKICVQKRLAEPWSEQAYEIQETGDGADYSVDDYSNGELIDFEAIRFMFVDVQMHSFWWIIRAVTDEGESKLIACGQVFTYQEIEEVRLRYKVMQPKLVHLDCQWNTGNVLNKCAEFGWTAFQGRPQKFFPVRTATGTRMSIVSRPQKGISPSGKPVTILQFSTLSCLDLLAELRAGRVAKWEFPHDVPDVWRKHMRGKRKRKVVSAKTKQVSYIWDDGGRDDHLMDCEMGCVGAMVVGKFLQEPKNNDKSNEEMPDNLD